jgi:hypothetical protein
MMWQDFGTLKKIWTLSLKIKLTKLHIFLKQTPIDMKTNAFNICRTYLWFANTYIQFILNSYAITTYYTWHVYN